MSENNIYAPPTADLDSQENTRYLTKDGYSEDCMLLCNEYFKSPKICIKTGEDLQKLQPSPEPRILTIGRYMPSIKDSILVQAAWFIRLTFLFIIVIFCILFNIKMGNLLFTGPLILALTVFYLIHLFLNICSAQTIKIPLYLSESFTKKRRRHFNIWNYVLLLSAIIPFTAIVIEIPDIYTAFSILGICLSLSVIMFSAPLFRMRRRRGEYYYVSGVHPYFLAALPLRN